jgi:hypothetical protein
VLALLTLLVPSSSITPSPQLQEAP